MLEEYLGVLEVVGPHEYIHFPTNDRLGRQKEPSLLVGVLLGWGCLFIVVFPPVGNDSLAYM